MNNGANDRQLDELLTFTKQLLTAIKNYDNVEISRLLDQRQQSIDTVKAAGGLADDCTPEQRKTADEIVSLDKTLVRELDRYLKDSKIAAQNFQKKAIGFKKYNYEILNMSSPNLLDEKR